MDNKVFDYQFLESAVTVTFLLVALTAIGLTIYFFIIQRISKKKKIEKELNKDSNVGRYFIRTDLSDENK